MGLENDARMSKCEKRNHNLDLVFGFSLITRWCFKKYANEYG